LMGRVSANAGGETRSPMRLAGSSICWAAAGMAARTRSARCRRIVVNLSHCPEQATAKEEREGRKGKTAKGAR